MRRIIPPLVLLALVTACGSDTKEPASTAGDSPATVAGSDSGSGADGTDGGTVDPAVTEGCDILTPEQMASVLGEAQDPYNPNLSRTDVTDCQWYSADGRSIGFQIDLLNEPDAVLLRRGRAVEVGNEAFVEGGDFPRFEADIHGWPVLAYGLNGAVTVDDVVALGRLLDAVLADRAASGDGSEAGTDDTVAADGVVMLTDMTVTIEKPARLAGTMTLADLNSTSSLAMCGGPWTMNSIGKMFTVVYEYGVMADTSTSPAPIIGLSLTAQGEYYGPGRYEAQMRFASAAGETTGVGLMTVNLDELSGSFVLEARGGDIIGTWTCAGS